MTTIAQLSPNTITQESAATANALTLREPTGLAAGAINDSLLARKTRDYLIEHLGEKGRAAANPEADALQRSLEGPAPSPVKRLLAERIVLCRLHVHFLELGVAAAHRSNDVRLAQHNAYQDWLDRAHRRYVHAIRALAQVRRLLVPVVQVNVGQNQINLAAGAQQPDARGRSVTT